MNDLRRPTRLSEAKCWKQGLVWMASLALLFATLPPGIGAQDTQDSQAPPPQQQGQAPAPQYNPQSPEQLQQLVAPIALYPDSLVAQILSAATFPEQVVEADRWVQAHPDLKGDALGRPWTKCLGTLA